MIPRTLNALLSLVGLMRIAEHEADCDLCNNTRVVRDGVDIRSYPETAPCPKCRDGYWALKAARDWRAKFKLAATDLAKHAEEIGELREAAHRDGVRYNELASDRDNWRRECLELRPDALLWRKARDKRAHDRKDSKKGVSRG